MDSPNSGTRPANTATLVAERLTLSRGGRTLFSELSFQAKPGDYIEVRGPNGAGKTSLLRTLVGLIRPQSGRVRIADADAPELAMHLIGHRDGLKPTIDAQAHLRFWAGLFGGEEALIDPALDRLGLAPLARLPARMFSQGQARRLALARLLVASRPIWLLDEPAAALDTNARSVLLDMIAAHRAGGGIAIAAVHDALGPEPARTIALGAT